MNNEMLINKIQSFSPALQQQLANINIEKISVVMDDLQKQMDEMQISTELVNQEMNRGDQVE